MMVRVVSYLIKTFDTVIPVKDLQHVLGLIYWLGTPTIGHLPFLRGVYCAVHASFSGWIRVTQHISQVTATLVALLPFQPPAVVTTKWKFITWILVDAADFVRAFGRVLYRVYDPVGGARAFVCPS